MNKLKKIIEKMKQGFLQKIFQEIKWIYVSASEYKGQILIYTILTVLVSCVTLLISVQLKDFVDLLLVNEWKGVMQVAFFYIGVGLFNVILAMLTQRLAGVISNKIRKNFIEKIYRTILMADWEKMNQIHSGDIITRLGEDATLISTAIVDWIPKSLSLVIQIMVTAILIIYYDFSLIAVIAIIGPIILLGTQIFMKKMYHSSVNQRNVVSEVMTFFKESYQNILTIKAFGLFRIFNQKSENLQKKRYNIELEVNKYSILSWGVMYVNGQLGAMVCLAWVLFHIYQGKISIGTMTVLIVLASSMATAFKQFVQLLPNSITTIASAERLRRLLLIENEKLIEDDKVQQFLKDGNEKGMRIEIEHLDFSYQNGKQVFKDVFLSAKPGEIVALVGPSGEGKTTMLRVLLGLVKVKQGKALVGIGLDGKETMEIGPSIRRAVSYVPQGNTMMSGTIADNLRIVYPEATDEEIEEALESACAMEFVRKLPGGINYVIGEGGIGFSEGQNQRLAIARALLWQTPILFLDEATSALDLRTERIVLENMMKKAKTRTCILTTHRLGVLAMCDKVYRIADMKVTQLSEEEIYKVGNDI
ncbi:Putative multidrug export ATP-binding/permease protein [Clostridiales bacterium CHKCI001]|nr:Putative multidrug export ATP-binding/permease protein [Clostridiales bacterium CHKCI001]